MSRPPKWLKESAQDIEEAAARFAEFHGEDAETVDEIDMPDAAFVLGEIESVTYLLIEGNREVRYIHDFETPPGLAISSDGKTAFILAGGWIFTKRGFEG